MRSMRMFAVMTALMVGCGGDAQPSSTDPEPSADATDDVVTDADAAADVAVGDTTDDVPASRDVPSSDAADTSTSDGIGSDTADDGGNTDADLDSDTDIDVSLDAAVDTGMTQSPPHLILIVLDDVGVEVVEPWASRFGVGADVAATPTLDRLALAGVVFETAWATPTCSPTRAGLHTGLYPSHAGVLGPVGRGPVLEPDQVTLPRLLGDRGYRTGLFGKWHLGGDADAPITRGGWDAYAGQPDGVLAAYDTWDRTVASVTGVTTTESTDYATSAVVDDALSWLREQPNDVPWLVMLAFHAPHTPHHIPPADLRPGIPDAALDADGDGVCDDDGACMRAMLTAADTEIGRFLDTFDTLSTGRDRVVVVLGDNGSTRSVIQAPWSANRAKGTLYEGGIRVPVWVDGPDDLVAASSTATGLAHAAVDIFATLVDLAGADMPDNVDGVSLVPALNTPDAAVRTTLYTDGNHSDRRVETEGAVARTTTHKVLLPDVAAPDDWACFDLVADPNEQVDLRESDAPAVCETLRTAIDDARR